MANCEKILTSDKVTSKVRDERIDSVKYWLIVLVIAGHVIERLDIPNNVVYAQNIWNWIYIFHMPLFVFISGYFSRKKNGCNLFLDIWKLLEPLLLFQLLIKTTEYFVKGNITWYDIFTPWWVLWYLLCLIYWRLLLQIIPDKYLTNSKLFIFFTFFISILAGFFPFGRLFSLQRMFSFMPFFFMGYHMKNRNLFFPKYKTLFTIFIISSFITTFLFPHHFRNLTHIVSYSNCYDALSRFFVFVIAIPISLSFINICPQTSWTANQGKYTMQYYIFHSIIIPPFVFLVNKLYLPITLIYSIIYIIMILAIIWITSFVPNFNKLTNPSSFLKK